MMQYFPPKPTYIPASGDIFKSLDNDRNWIAETKLNGFRAISFGKDLYTRHGRKVVIAMKEREYLVDGTEFDCEWVNKNGVLKLFIFDIMRYQDKDISGLPLIDRKKILLSLNIPIVIPWVYDNKVEFYHKCIKSGYEGIVLKRIDSRYEKFPVKSREITSWLKVKPKKISFTGGYEL